MRGKILIVDDEKDIRDLIRAYLEKEGYQVFEAEDGRSAIEHARLVHPDLAVLDIMLPHLSGLEVLSKLRRESELYVILLTAKTEEIDKLVGLNMGADDYLTKPFSPKELVARINAAMRRLSMSVDSGRKQAINFAHVRLDPAARLVWLDDQPLDLTAIEFDLLWTLMAQAGQALSRDQLLEQVWGSDYYGDTRTVDVHIGHIRRKLGDRFITTVWGVGYRFEDERI